MNKLLLILLTIVLSLSFNSCSSLSGSSSNLEKVPNVGLYLTQKPIDEKVNCYFYITQNNFAENRSNLHTYLGDQWALLKTEESTNKKVEASLSKKQKDQKLEGSASFYSPKYPNKRIVVLQLKKGTKPSVFLIYDETK